MFALLAAARGWRRAQRRADAALHAGPGAAAREVIVQVATVGPAAAAREVLAHVRSLPCQARLALWVVVEQGAYPDDAFPEADRVVVVPADFRCRARAKGRALEWARRVRETEGITGADTKILLLDDDSVPTGEYLRMAIQADADVAQGLVAPRRHYGRVLSHLDDLRPIHCLAVCSWAQASGHPVHVHGEGLCVRASAEHTVTWDADGSALAEDLVFGQRAAAAGLRWAFLPAVVQITSPWTAGAFVTQRRRWTWGTLQALGHLPRRAALRVAALYLVTLGGFALSVTGSVLSIGAGRRFAGPWLLSLVAWLTLSALAGWIGSDGRRRQALLAVALAWPAAIANALVVPLGVLLGPPRGFRTIAKLSPRRRAPALPRLVVAAAGAALIVLPAALSTSASSSPERQARVPAARQPPSLAGPAPIAVERRRVTHIPRRPDFAHGLSVIAYGNDPYFGSKALRLLDRIRAAGATHVSLVVPLFTGGRYADSVTADPQRTPSSARILAFAAAAHRRGLTVGLSPLLDEGVLAQTGSWRGALAPADRHAWFRSYGQTVARFASLARIGRFQALNVGTEFESLTSDDAGWQSVLGRVRRRFHGTVTYAMAGSRVLDHRIPWLLRHVDVIGVNAWYELDAPDGAPVAELASALVPWRKALNGFRRRAGRPVILTEAGAPAQRGGYRRPTLVQPGVPVDLTAQDHVYRALCGFARHTHVRGVIWWATTLDPPRRPSTDGGFDPLGKPAEHRIAACRP